MVGDIGGMLLASLDGVAVGVSEAGPIAGRTVEIVRGNTYDEEANVGPGTIPYIAALYPLTGSFLAQFLMTYPDAYIGSAGLVVAVVLQTLQQLASFNIAAAETMFGSLPTAAIRFRGTSAPLSLSTAT